MLQVDKNEGVFVLLFAYWKNFGFGDNMASKYWPVRL